MQQCLQISRISDCNSHNPSYKVFKEKNGKLKKCILQLEFAYAIMPVGEKDAKVPCEQRMKSPNRVGPQFGDSSFLFIAAKHPLGYLLLLSSPSNHLMM